MSLCIAYTRVLVCIHLLILRRRLRPTPASPHSAYYFDLTLGHTCGGHKSQTRAGGREGEGAEGGKSAHARCIGDRVSVRATDRGLALLFISPRLVKNSGTRIYRGNIEMRDTGRGPTKKIQTEKERQRETECGSTFPFHPANTHTRGEVAHPLPPRIRASRAPSDKKLTTAAVALRADIFYSR